MSWATTFNTGMNPMGTSLSNQMSNIKLDTNISPAEIQAKINQHSGGATSGQNGVQTVPNIQSQPVGDTFQQNPAVTNPVQYNTYQAPMGYQMTANYPAYTQYPVYNQPVSYQPVTYQQPTTYQQPMTYQQPVSYAMPQYNQAPQVYTANNSAASVQTYQDTLSAPINQNGQNLDINTSNPVANGSELSFSSSKSENNAKELASYYEMAKEGQGLISKGTDKVKSFFNMDGSSKNTQKIIDSYNKGQISYDEAIKAVSKFEESSKSSVNAVTTLLSGAGAYIGTALAASKGATTGKAVIIATAIGAGIKALTNMTERGTNGITGDALNAADIVKDLSKGAITGAAVGGSAVLASDKLVIPSASNGAATGAIAGAVSGATDYSIDCIVEPDKEFSINDMIGQSVKYAVGGAVIGAGVGAASKQFIKTDGAIQQEAPKQTQASGQTQANSAQQAQAATPKNQPAAAKDTKLTYDSIQDSLKTNGGAHYTDAEIGARNKKALADAMKLETDEGICSAYQTFNNSGNAEEKLTNLKKLRKVILSKYHPDANINCSTAEIESATRLYNQILDKKYLQALAAA